MPGLRVCLSRGTRKERVDLLGGRFAELDPSKTDGPSLLVP